MTKGVPAHLMPPNIKETKEMELKKRRMLDWGLPMNKLQRIPSNEEIVNMFSENERLKMVYSSSFLLLMLHDYISYDVLFYCKYPRLPMHKESCRQLNDYAKEIERTHHQANPFLITQKMGEVLGMMKKDCETDYSKLKLSTSQALLTHGKCNHSLAIAINNALLMIECIKRHGEYVGNRVGELAGIQPQDYRLSKMMIKVRAVLNKMAKMEDCQIPPSQNMILAVDILTNKFIGYLK